MSAQDFGRATSRRVVVLGRGLGRANVIDWPTLRRIASQVFVDRNSVGAPASKRAVIRKAVRPHLRAAIKCVRRSAAAARADNLEAHALHLQAALTAMSRAETAFRQPFMDDARKSIEAGRKGGRPPDEMRNTTWRKCAEDFKRRNPKASQSRIIDHVRAGWDERGEDKQPGRSTVRDVLKPRSPSNSGRET